MESQLQDENTCVPTAESNADPVVVSNKHKSDEADPNAHLSIVEVFYQTEAGFQRILIHCLSIDNHEVSFEASPDSHKFAPQYNPPDIGTAAALDSAEAIGPPVRTT